MFKFLHALLVAFFKPVNSFEESNAKESNSATDASFEKRILGMDPAELAAIDAKVEANRKDPNDPPPALELIDDPDPLGMDWEWLEESDKQDPLSPDV